MTTPALRAYRKSFPEDELVFIIGKSCEKVLTMNPHIDRLLTFSDENIYNGSLIAKVKETLHLIRLLRSLKAERIFVMQRHWMWNLVSRLSGISVRYGFGRDKNGKYLTHPVYSIDDYHEIDSYIEVCKLKDGFKPDGHGMDMFASEVNRKRSETLTEGLFDKDVIALAPGGGANVKTKMDIKRWPGFNELARHILETTEMNILFIGAQEDRDLIDFKSLDKSRTRDLCGKVSLGGSYHILKKCRLLVSNDSGAMHLGAAAAIPVIGIFGPTDPHNLYPITHHQSRYIWLNVDCSPCYKDGDFPSKTDHKCMTGITKEAVYAQIEEILKGK
ncbi:glycosyltransferase family 9 protein [Limisalsivibrio acetivorans]|uniref:glycosyltransferase family 9 protein n=1 Tax=Limisalsivibrio acetivorans TaxID=1304888 RepID=UPI0003B6C91C|nr:glycosyltransferase family 9 protein [Limisalsivibrio acetivorans]